MFLGCNLSAKQPTAPIILYELDLLDELGRAEGSSLELEKNTDSCRLTVKIYEQQGKTSYTFKFKKNNLISTEHIKYRYQNGLMIVDDDLKDLIAESSEQEPMELISHQTIIANDNNDITRNFKFYKEKIPYKILKDNCS